MNEFSSIKCLPASIKIPNSVQVIAKIIHFFSPRLTIFLAAKLFTSPIDYKRPKREFAMLEASQRKKLFVPSIGKEIDVLSYGYSNKKVLLAHGWAGRSTQLFMIANKLLENGYMVISFDAPAHGSSTGKTTNLLENVTTVKALCSAFGPFVAGIGHSFGGMTLLNAEAKYNAFNCLVTVGSGDTISIILQNFAFQLGLKKKIGNKLYQYFKKKWQVEIDNFASSEMAKKITIPSFTVHDALDGDVHVSCAVKIRQNLKNGQLLITNGLGHTKILRDQESTNRIVNFIIKNS